MISVFRILIPGWRFFDRAPEEFQLFYRLENHAKEVGEWTPAISRDSRKWYALFFNPDGNMSLAARSLVERFLDELGERDSIQAAEVEKSVSYELVKNWVSSEIRRKEEAGFSEKREHWNRFQFKISGSDGDYLISPWHESREANERQRERASS